VRGGTYAGGFQCHLVGTEAAPITVRNYAGERVILDNALSANSSLHLPPGCRWVRIWGLEFVDTDPKRVTDVGGNTPPIHRGGGFNQVDVQGANIKLINCVSRDGACGIGLWNNNTSWGAAKNAEVYGCLVFNNGWHAPTRGSGHGIYAQNTHSTANPSLLQVRETIVWNSFGYGLHAYSESEATLTNMLFEGVVSFNNGSPTAAFRNNGYRDPNICAVSTRGAKGITIRNCFLYHPTGTDGVNLYAGRTGQANTDMVLENSFLGGASLSVLLQGWQSLRVGGNTFMNFGGDAKFVALETNNGQAPTGVQWNNNLYYDATAPAGNGGRYTFTCDGVRDQASGGGTTAELRFAAWRAGTGFDAANTYYPGGALPNRVAVRPNAYEKGRAHVVIYNWERRPVVAVDLSASGLANGQAFEIRNVQNYFGAPVLTGTYNSSTPAVNVPMTDTAVTPPVGFEAYPIPSTLPEFGAFVVLPR
jgi:hypothetical protein